MKSDVPKSCVYLTKITKKLLIIIPRCQAPSSFVANNNEELIDRYNNVGENKKIRTKSTNQCTKTTWRCSSCSNQRRRRKYTTKSNNRINSTKCSNCQRQQEQQQHQQQQRQQIILPFKNLLFQNPSGDGKHGFKWNKRFIKIQTRIFILLFI